MAAPTTPWRVRALAGAQVFVEADWQGFAVQRTRQLAHVQTDYVFFLDADEVMSPDFQQELQAVVRSGSQSVWQVRWRMVAFGRELRYLRGPVPRSNACFGATKFRAGKA